MVSIPNTAGAKQERHKNSLTIFSFPRPSFFGLPFLLLFLLSLPSRPIILDKSSFTVSLRDESRLVKKAGDDTGLAFRKAGSLDILIWELSLLVMGEP